MPILMPILMPIDKKLKNQNIVLIINDVRFISSKSN